MFRMGLGGYVIEGTMLLNMPLTLSPILIYSLGFLVGVVVEYAPKTLVQSQLRPSARLSKLARDPRGSGRRRLKVWGV